MTVSVKICGLTRPADLAAVAAAGAAYAGFVHFPKSPRHLTAEALAALAPQAPAGLCKVLLTVDAEDALLDALLAAAPIDMLQLHGRESPARVAALRDRFGLPVMKAVGVADESDLHALEEAARAADQLLIDAKPPKGAAVPGGNGLAFDWRLLSGRRIAIPWMLAGGLTPENAAEAVRLTGARQLDVSSGVEARPGEKDPAKIRAFLAAATAAEAA